MRSAISLIVATMFAGLVMPAWAQLKIPQEYDKTVKATASIAALGDDLFGDQTSLYTGSTSFNAVDVSLPGNNKLVVEIRRKFRVTSTAAPDRPRRLTRDGGFSDWELDIPYLEGVYAAGRGWQTGEVEASNQRCSFGGGEAPLVEGSPRGFWAGPEYWHGNTLNVPGGGAQEMLVVNPGNPNRPSTGGPYLWVTNSNWFFSCIPTTANGVAGDAFMAHAPNGLRYTFNWIVKREAPTLIKHSSAPVDVLSIGGRRSTGMRIMASTNPESTALLREEVRILPTRIEDGFGNYITYTYDAAKPWRLKNIAASDGRTLTLTYNASGHISSVTDGTRTWTYAYASGLSQVTLPDQSKWTINFSNLRDAYTRPDDQLQLACEWSGASPVQDAFIGTITHPSGATGNFTFKSAAHGRSYVPKACIYPDPITRHSNYARTPFLFNEVALQKKVISGAGLATATWTYTYGTPNNSWLESCGAGCVGAKTLVVSGPESQWTRYTYGNRYQYNEGLLLKIERGSSAAAIQSVEDLVYQHDASGQIYPQKVGNGVYSRGDHMAERLAPLKLRTTALQGSTFKWSVVAECGSGSTLCFDTYARPIKVKKESSP